VLPSGLRSEAVIRAFENAGGVRRHGKGSHVNVKMPNGQLITIPGHGEVKIGLLQAAIRRSGLTVEEFLELLRR
jgi:predicted RNA binding protein YcfA (HicA-like mRNA interferase family)